MKHLIVIIAFTGLFACAPQPAKKTNLEKLIITTAKKYNITNSIQFENFGNELNQILKDSLHYYYSNSMSVFDTHKNTDGEGYVIHLYCDNSDYSTYQYNYDIICYTNNEKLASSIIPDKSYTIQSCSKITRPTKDMLSMINSNKAIKGHSDPSIRFSPLYDRPHCGLGILICLDPVIIEIDKKQ